LDVHTARWIVEKCFEGDLIRGRTVLLVVCITSPLLIPIVIPHTPQTHNIAMASPLANYVVSLGKDGCISSRGTVSDALKKDRTLAKELAEGARAIKDDEKKIDLEEPDEVAKVTDGKLILAEEITEGHVSWDASEHANLFRISDHETHCCPTKTKLSCLLTVWEERTQSYFGCCLSAAWCFPKPS
jgi:hypothetical protein